MSVVFNMKNKETLLSRIDIKVDIKCQCGCLQIITSILYLNYF